MNFVLRGSWLWKFLSFRTLGVQNAARICESREQIWWRTGSGFSFLSFCRHGFVLTKTTGRFVSRPCNLCRNARPERELSTKVFTLGGCTCESGCRDTICVDPLREKLFSAPRPVGGRLGKCSADQRIVPAEIESQRVRLRNSVSILGLFLARTPRFWGSFKRLSTRFLKAFRGFCAGNFDLGNWLWKRLFSCHSQVCLKVALWVL
jgi:hypothetical protein